MPHSPSSKCYKARTFSYVVCGYRDASRLLLGSKIRWSKPFQNFTETKDSQAKNCDVISSFQMLLEKTRKGKKSALWHGFVLSTSEFCDSEDHRGSVHHSITLSHVTLSLIRLSLWCSSTSPTGLQGLSGQGLSLLVFPELIKLPDIWWQKCSSPITMPPTPNFFLQIYFYGWIIKLLEPKLYSPIWVEALNL